MRMRDLITKTSKSSRADADSINADLLTRAGYVHKTMAGVYSFLPLGWRVLRNIEDILRKHMDRIGVELFLPSLTSMEQWDRTGRLNTVSVLFQACAANDISRKIHDAHYVLNSTHEEVITPLVQNFCTSYKDLPCAAYQIQTKFRNEPRAKSGLLRCREFRMKDLYSFHTTEEDMLNYFFKKAIPAYQGFFEEVGLGDRTVITLASGGDFSKEYSREFQTRCDTGEDWVFQVPETDTCYNREIAPSKAPLWGDEEEELRERKDVLGKGIIGVAELAAYLNIEVERTTKTLLFVTEKGAMVAAMVRGGYDVNEEKLRKIVGCTSLELAPPEMVTKMTGAAVGYAGPIGLPKSVQLIWDESTANRKNFECGANVTDMHSLNVNFGRDVALPKQFHDIKTAKDGDLDPGSGKTYEVFRASEVGNVFTLYTKFSDAFDFRFKDKDGKEKPVYMGCYGIGTSRILGVLAEVFHDDVGLRWPEAVAPFQVHLLTLGKEQAVKDAAEKLYAELQASGIDVLIDDRDASAGEKFADSDLIGIPHRLVISARTLKENGVEWKRRTSKETQTLAWKHVVQHLRK
jgi:prolyl-tRNA synthetase